MTVKRDLPDLTRTALAIAAYDEFDSRFDEVVNMNTLHAVEALEKLEKLGWEVGHAFGLDTADRNSIQTCEQCIRPGFKVPGPGCEESFVRRMVKLSQLRIN